MRFIMNKKVKSYAIRENKNDLLLQDLMNYRVYEDKIFRQKLLANPMATLKEEGVKLPTGVSINVHENTETECHLVIPLKPPLVPPPWEETPAQRLERENRDPLGWLRRWMTGWNV
jgi:Nitrile hydratase, alpha chain